MRDAVLFDMDGTLCDVRPIRHLIAGKDRNFHAFHTQSINCPPHAHVVEAAHRAHAEGKAVVIVTARMRRYEKVTGMWLALNGVPSDDMFMRADGDYRKDYVVKREMLTRIRASYNPVHAWDDNPAVLKVWEEGSIPYTLVPGWDET